MRVRCVGPHTLPAASAAAIAFGGSVTEGKAYMAPCGWLQDTPSSALSPSTSIEARRFMLERMASCRCGGARPCQYAGTRPRMHTDMDMGMDMGIGYGHGQRL